MSERIYYRVEANSPVIPVIQRALDSHREFCRAMVAFQKEIGATEIWTSGGTEICGAKFPGDLPEGWRAGSKYAAPDKRNKAGKEISRKMKSLPKAMDSWEFSSAMNAAFPTKEQGNEGFFYWGDGHVYFTSWGKYGDTYILSVPAKCRVKPEGCTELKMSEYWALKESVGAIKP